MPTFFQPNNGGADVNARIDQLIAIFEDDSFAKREDASQGLLKMGLVAEPQLRQAMKSPDAEFRVRARTILNKMCSGFNAKQLDNHTADLESVDFSPDSRWMVVSDQAGHFRLLEVGTWKLLADVDVNQLGK